MRRDIDRRRTELQYDLQKIMAVQPKDRPAVGMDIPDLLQLRGNPLGILQPREEDEAVHLADFAVLLVDRTDLACDHKAGDHFPRHAFFPDPVLILEHVKAVLRRFQLLRQLLPPCRMREITGSHDMDSLPPCPEVEMLRRAVPARRPRIAGMDM